MELTELDVDMIVTIDRKRPVNDSNVQYLADSIKRVGLQTPITVRIVSKMDDPVTGEPLNDVPVLVSGAHRLAAVRLLGLEEIDAFVMYGTDVEYRLWEISENLHRAELTRLERDEHVAEWIKLTEEKQDDDASPLGTHEQKKAGQQAGGINAAARELGVGKSDAHRAIKHAAIAPEAKDAIVCAGLSNSRAVLDAVAATPAEQQVLVVAEIVAKKATPKPPQPASDALEPKKATAQSEVEQATEEFATWLFEMDEKVKVQPVFTWLEALGLNRVSKAYKCIQAKHNVGNDAGSIKTKNVERKKSALHKAM